jgi:hypothetical protein
MELYTFMIVRMHLVLQHCFGGTFPSPANVIGLIALNEWALSDIRVLDRPELG